MARATAAGTRSTACGDATLTARSTTLRRARLLVAVAATVVRLLLPHELKTLRSIATRTHVRRGRAETRASTPRAATRTDFGCDCDSAEADAAEWSE